MIHDLTPNNFETKKCLVVVSGKEHGMIYITNAGVLRHVEHITEHPPTYSDNEGFFFRSSHGRQLGSGAPHEVDKQRNIERYINAIGEELSGVVSNEQPELILLFEPEYLKGLVSERLRNPNHIPVHVLDYGNFVHESPHEIKDRIIKLLSSQERDPADPASVDRNEPNADEKRRILEIGKQLDGG